MMTIKVFRNGSPLEGAKVWVYWGIANAYGKEGRTDRHGEVNLDVDPNREAKVIINGTVESTGHLRPSMTFHV
jgi:hypothetical protein